MYISFQCKAMAVNVAGEAETTARVSMVQTPPTFGRRPERSQDIMEGETLELKAKIDGSPKPRVCVYTVVKSMICNNYN